MKKIGGSFHLTPGNAYEVADNGNRSRIHWDLVQIQRPDTVAVKSGSMASYCARMAGSCPRICRDSTKGCNAWLSAPRRCLLPHGFAIS